MILHDTPSVKLLNMTLTCLLSISSAVAQIPVFAVADYMSQVFTVWGTREQNGAK